MKLSVPEILKIVDAAPKKDRVMLLQRNDNTVLRDILRINFDPTVKFDLPEGPAPYTADRSIPDHTLANSNLYNEARRLYIFEPGHPKYNPNVKTMRKETIWIEILEGIHHTEADMMNLVKDKKLSSVYKNVTSALVAEAFPDLIKVSKN